MEIEQIMNRCKTEETEHREYIEKCLLAERYYRNDTDIKHKHKYNGYAEVDNRIAMGWYKNSVDQVRSYLFPSPVGFSTDDNETDAKVLELLGRSKFSSFCSRITTDALNDMRGWAHIWVEDGRPRYAVIDPKQIQPVFSEHLERQIEGVRRLYYIKGDDNKSYAVNEFWNGERCYRYYTEATPIKEKSGLRYTSNFPTGEPDEVFEHGLGVVPFIPFESGSDVPELDRVKEIIDAAEMAESILTDMIEAYPQVIYVLKGSEGEVQDSDPTTILQDIKRTTLIMLDAGDEEIPGSSIERMTTEIPYEACVNTLKELRDRFWEAVQGIDIAETDFGNISAVAIDHKYDMIELKAQGIENAMREGFNALFTFFYRFLGVEPVEIKQSWTRNKPDNFSDRLEEALKMKSLGFSQETIFSLQFPGEVPDPVEEVRKWNRENGLEVEEDMSPFTE